MPELHLVHRVEFSAAHHLVAPGRSAAENHALYGPCARPHGHNYRLDVTVAGAVQAGTGMVMDLLRLAELVRERLVSQLDHVDLNRDVPWLAGVITTGENLLPRFWERLGPALPPGVRLVELRLRETRDSTIVYRGPEDGR